MRFPPPRQKNDEERILPLINVVFLLLIFFMLAGKLASSDPFEVAPPRSASEGLAGAQDMLVLVGVDGTLAIDGARVERAALKSAVAKRLASTSDIQIRLKADGRVEATQVVAVMELLREAGVERLKLLTVAETR